MKKRVFVLVLVATMVLTNFTVFGAFSDLTDKKWDWAREAIEEMAESDIILGYDDGTFKPESSVSKEEALLLMARVAGLSQSAMAPYVELAEERYQGLMDSLGTQYAGPISWLFDRGVLSESDGQTYLSTNAATKPLLRYEAAILLTKLDGKEAEALAQTSGTTHFEDDAQIPAAAKKYVKYVFENELMLGMDENIFSPMTEVTRAQMAMLLYRIIPRLDYTYKTGKMASYAAGTQVLSLMTQSTTVSYKVDQTVAVKLDGVTTSVGNIAAGCDVVVTLSGDKAIYVDCLTPKFEGSVEGIFEKYQTASDGTIITIKDPVTKQSQNYSTTATYVVTYEGTTSSISQIKKDDFVILEIQDGKVHIIHAQQKEKQLTGGTITDIIFGTDFVLEITVGGTPTEYIVDSKVAVKRNGSTASLEDLKIGDSVTGTLTYNLLTAITATSKTSTVSGKLSAIKISASPSIEVTDANGKITTYPVLRDVKIIRNANEVDIYELRLSDNVTVSLESDTVVKIDLTSVPVSSSITGTIEFVNESYGYLKLSEYSELIFISKAKVTDSIGATKSIKDLKPDSKVTIFVTAQSGAYLASMIVIG